MYEDIYGLSCVENHSLAVLKERRISIAPLYHNCALQLKEIYHHMVVMVERQEYFNTIPRVQETMKMLDVISLVLTIQPNMRLVRYAIRSYKENEYILMKVTPAFTREVLRARGLRDDHFVLVRPNGKQFILKNDIPEKTLEISARQLTEAYGGDYLKMTVKREITDQDAEFLWKNRLFIPEQYQSFYINEKNLSNISDLGTKLRNMAGIYKTLRHRLAVYYGDYVDTGFVYDLLPEIEKIYSLFEYYNIKKVQSVEKYFSLFFELNEIENCIMTELNARFQNLHRFERNIGDYFAEI